MWYILDKDNKPVQCSTKEYCEWEEKNPNKKVVKQETINKTRISTVFLGLDHRFNGKVPVLWETMIFSDDVDYDQYQNRYTTYEDALKGHEEILNYVKNGIIPS